MDDRVTVLSPVPRKEQGDDRSGPAIDDLDGRLVALRLDWLWPAYNAVVEEWSARFTERGARVLTVNTREEQEGLSPEARQAHVVQTFSGVDLAVVGLGN